MLLGEPGGQGRDASVNAAVVADLYRSFLSDGDDSLSLNARIRFVKGSLLRPHNVCDWGVNSQTSTLRFVLVNAKYLDVKNLVESVQFILAQMVEELPLRERGYVIDMGGKLLLNLRGVDTLEILEHVWTYTGDQLFEVARNVSKYCAESRGKQMESPESTQASFYDQNFAEASGPEVLRKLLSHPKQRERYESAQRDASPMLDRLPSLEHLCPLNPELAVSFPPRSPQTSPESFTYNETTGEKEEAFSSQSSSQNTPKDWAPPPPSEPSGWN